MNKRSKDLSGNLFPFSSKSINNRIVLLVLGFLVVVLAILNIYTASHCLHYTIPFTSTASSPSSYSSSSSSSFGLGGSRQNGLLDQHQIAIQYRLQTLEEQNIENALLLESFVKKLDEMFHLLGPNTIHRLRERAHSTAASIALEDMEEVVPPLPTYLTGILELEQPEMNELMEKTYIKAYTNAVETRHILEGKEGNAINNQNEKWDLLQRQKNKGINVEGEWVEKEKEKEKEKEEEKERENIDIDDELSKESNRILKRMHDIEEEYFKAKEEKMQEKEKKKEGNGGRNKDIDGNEQDEDDLESLTEEIEIENREIQLCEKFILKYNINLGEDLGSMPFKHIQEWRTHDCDYILMKRNGMQV